MTAAKSRFFILGGLVSVSLAMGMAALVSSRPEGASPLQTVSHQSQKVEVQPVEKALYQYVVRDYQGKIAVYSSMEAQTPQYVTDFDTAVLPRQDREMLKEGIGLRNEEELQVLLEDYGS